MMFNFIKRHRTLVVIVLIVAGLCLLMYIKLFRGDIEPPDVSDLAIEYENIPDQENAFTYIDDAGEIYMTFHDQIKPREQPVRMTEYDAERMGELMSLCSKMFEKLDRGLACEKIQFPEMKSYLDGFPALGPWRQLGRMQLNRSLHLFMQGREEEALDVLLDTMKLGCMMESGKGGTIHYLVGAAVREMALEKFRVLLPKMTLAPYALKPYIKRLDEYAADGEALATCFKVNYRLCANTVDDVRDGNITTEELLSGEVSSSTPRKKRRTGYSFRPNETKKMMADLSRNAVSNTKKPFSEFTRPEVPVEPPVFGGHALYYGPNSKGRHLRDILMFADERLAIQKIHSNISIGATQLLIALKCYKIENSDLPETLDMLVPDYIDSLPEVDYDNKPLRYSKAKKIIYSIGDDMKDSGGTGRPTSRHARPGRIVWSMDDHVLKIDF